ncbi:hypothetical protein Ate02nite_09910 [Paractinoplanes tereljensis]|uniref:Uncharacterized protein n=1 Tax=Paractinoplanes tereljensis TaxID=571912 RepID=A0A919TQG7_9ACTN|nr:hypothetical protein Ate02nite_09910 [Actinoplanes tereljensis]
MVGGRVLLAVAYEMQPGECHRPIIVGDRNRAAGHAGDLPEHVESTTGHRL